jgi:hypothetical protein
MTPSVHWRQIFFPQTLLAIYFIQGRLDVASPRHITRGFPGEQGLAAGRLRSSLVVLQSEASSHQASTLTREGTSLHRGVFPLGQEQMARCRRGSAHRRERARMYAPILWQATRQDILHHSGAAHPWTRTYHARPSTPNRTVVSAMQRQEHVKKLRGIGEGSELYVLDMLSTVRGSMCPGVMWEDPSSYFESKEAAVAYVRMCGSLTIFK